MSLRSYGRSSASFPLRLTILTKLPVSCAKIWTPGLAPSVRPIASGLTYVNVHTNDGVDGPNTGPGDFPGGEIRGQLDHGR